MPKLSTTDDLLLLERAVRKVINKSFKDRTLDYSVQFGVSSLEPKKVKYSFMINGTKQEIRVEPQSFYSFKEALAVAEGMLKEIDVVALEKTFHESRVNTHNIAAKQHQDRLDQLNNPKEDDDENIPDGASVVDTEGNASNFDDLTASMEQLNPLHTMDDDQLLSAMTLADRAQDWDNFSRYRRELLYRLACAKPLINWYKPTRRGR